MAKSQKLMGVQQDRISTDKETQAILEYLCTESNNLNNCALYYARQIYFKTRQFVTGFDIVNAVGKNRHFAALPSEVAVQTCMSVGESIQSFAELVKKRKKGELDQEPKIPNYRKPGGLNVISFPRRHLKIINGQIKFPLGMQVKAWFGIKNFFLSMPSNLRFEEIKEIHILPRNREFYIEFVYEIPTSTVITLDKSKVLGIDHGINNWLTCVSNIGTSFIVDGLHLKSLNQWYNKSVARLKKDKPQGFWSNRLAGITEKRNRQMRNAVNKAARIVINHCLENKIGSIVFGWNTGQKDGCNMGDLNTQNFVQIPTGRLKKRIEQLCQQYGISFIETEESYTSKASFLDNDVLPKYNGEKPVRVASRREGWKSSGSRISRGLFKTANGIKINADCNGAANIIKKVAIMAKLNLAGIGRGCLSQPKKVRLWTLQKSQCL